MADNRIELKSIFQLLGMKFFIPNYQRGYRWTPQQVKDLLEDIRDFTNKPEKPSAEFYCLQPIVVREMTVEEKLIRDLHNEDTWYEVIDGQQRLLTLYLILTAYRTDIKEYNMPTETYEIVFERESTLECKSIDNLETISNVDASSIDRMHVSEAMIEIKNWKNAKLVNADKLCKSLLAYEPRKEGTQLKDYANNVRVIWYQSVDEDPIAVFTRLNIGKISLTNSELIKALVLNRSNFKTFKNENLIRLRQQEIAGEWDAMETTLQDDSFWLFLHNPNYDRPTRIDFIFELLKSQNALDLSNDELLLVGNDDYCTFRYFYTYFQKSANVDINVDIEELWDGVKKMFHALREWYNDPVAYHYIGYLLYYSVPTLLDILKKWDGTACKKEFLDYLKAEVKKKISSCPALDADYKLDGSDKGRYKPILFFHNIQTAINLNKHTKISNNGFAYRFPFDAFKKEGWDVEHINSNTTNPEEDDSTKKEWLFNVYLSVTDDLQSEIMEYFSDKDSKANGEKTVELFAKVRDYMPEINAWTQQQKNKLWNFALLDSSTNRSYGNAIFPAKRRIIISKDSGRALSIPKLTRDGKIEIPKAETCASCFVPPATKQIFLKYYSPTIGNNNYWDISTDAAAYLEDIKSCISQLDV